MTGPTASILARPLGRLAAWCGRHAVLVLALAVALTAIALLEARANLGVSTDTDELFAKTLPWKQRQAAFAREFPQFQDLIVVLVDGTPPAAGLAIVPEAADVTADQLAAVLARDTTHFADVRRPDASPYFNQEGLLFLDRAELGGLLDHTIDAQPFLGALAADPSARGLFAALSLLAMGVEQGQADLSGFEPALRGFHAALAGAGTPAAAPLSWQSLLGGGLAEKAGPFRFVLVHPRLDYGAISPGGDATDAIHAAAASLPFVAAGLARVRLTGQVPLADEEFSTVAQGAAVGLIGSLVLVSLWLFLAVGSWRLVLPVVLTLLFGLAMTILFATLAVGRLNVISVAFAVLFVGIAVDFAIQFSVRLREQQRGSPLSQALEATGRLAGGQILIAALTTAAGFLAFVPTDFVGVAELGLIAGAGMLIAFACTLTFLPAAIAVCAPRRAAAEIGYRWAGRLDAPLARHRRLVLALFGLVALAGLAVLPTLPFDSDPLHTKNPDTESMRALEDLVANPMTSPYSVDILAADLPAANALAEKLAALPLVDSVTTLSSFVPTDQGAKLALIADAAGLLGPTLDVAPSQVPLTAQALREAVRAAGDQLSRAALKLAPSSPIALLAGDLARLRDAPDATLLAANDSLTRFLPMQLDRLRASLSAKPVTAADIPPSIARDWILPDGRVRVNAVARPGGRDRSGQLAFVDQVRAVAPDAGGSSVTIVATTQTIVSAFIAAAAGAIVAIALILLVALRRALDAALVLAPLLLAALLTGLLLSLLGLPINFANIIALPLLLGVGVSFNIYFVMNWRAGETHPLGSATARAVLFSALTTATAFGSLALSAHPGTASMGTLLLLSLLSTLVATLLFVPALLAACRRMRPNS